MNQGGNLVQLFSSEHWRTCQALAEAQDAYRKQLSAELCTGRELGCKGQVVLRESKCCNWQEDPSCGGSRAATAPATKYSLAASVTG